MRHLALALLLAAACGDNTKASVPDDAGPDAPDAAPVGACLDRPTDLPMPPTGALPCELLPPGFTSP